MTILKKTNFNQVTVRFTETNQNDYIILQYDIQLQVSINF